jgi:hypothetical protein
MEQDPRVVDRKQEEARGSATRKIPPLYYGLHAEWDPAEGVDVARAEEAVVVKAEDEAVDRAGAGDRNFNPINIQRR